MGRMEPMGISGRRSTTILLSRDRKGAVPLVEVQFEQKKKPHAVEGVEHKGLLQSVSEDDRPVTMVSSAGCQINEKDCPAGEYFAGIQG